MYSASLLSSRNASDNGDLLSLCTQTLDASTPFSSKKLMMRRPIRSLPVSLMNVVFTPERPSDISPLNTEPPGTAFIGVSPLKIMSRTVSPIPITLRICRIYTIYVCKITHYYIFVVTLLLFFVDTKGLFNAI